MDAYERQLAAILHRIPSSTKETYSRKAIMNRVRSMPETWGAVGSAVLSFVFFWDVFRRYCPPELRRYLERCSVRLSGFFNPYVQISIHEYLGGRLKPHKAYAIVEAYLSANSSRDAKRLKAEMAGSKFTLSMDDYEKTADVFNGVPVKWISSKAPRQDQSISYAPQPERRIYRLQFHKKYKEMIIGSYLDHVIERGRAIRARTRRRKLYTNGHSSWSHIVFKHPARFETIAMDPMKKEEIMDDLLTFAKSKNYYARIGKPWKRGYLLFGPPGTGKSTMIAAMANLLDYDVYDLELTSVKDNTELRKLLTETTAKSIIVIEDIDCSLDLTGQREKKEEKAAEIEDDHEKKGKKNSSQNEKEVSRGSKVTLSGLLNFIDGLWSACAGERLIVFTTNYVDKLDPALTRRGRMDKHIELAYCKYEGFKVLAKNYLELEGHELFESVEELIEEVDITPADVAESLMPKSAKEGPEKCLMNLIDTLEEAKRRKAIKAKTETNGGSDAPQQEFET